ncbi:hypothetical protein [Spelaeicoccus albus]|uniref:Uncharacterized protein n=1 Tax=Spelaeicoccus albus TaxID=1280376 RepID=A0A7Z0A840_9MICO|nr:hypothetical protein [Spelaeicoccus albus]NYI66107.1 hypothetical protein [Spelaeicoccus albus]
MPHPAIDDGIAGARTILIRAREDGNDMWAIWATAAEIDRARKFGLSWDEVEGRIDLADPDTCFSEDRHVRAAWRMLIARNLDLVAAARQLLDEECTANWC